MGRTDFDVETLDAETLAERQAKVNEILHPTAASQPAPATPIVATQAPLPEPIPAPAEPEPKKQRTTVPKLLQRYQARVEELEASIATVKASIAQQQFLLKDLDSRLFVWREAIAEVEKD